jgi:hypothetical protein
MSKKAPAPKARKASRGAATTSIPPVVTAIAALSQSHGVGVPREFALAWQQMPAMVAALDIGEGDSIDHVTRHSIVERQIKAAVARSRKAEDDTIDGLLARAMNALEDTNDGPDAPSAIIATVAEPAFFCGMAYAAYMLTKGGAR